jgi:hypothetical protein
MRLSDWLIDHARGDLDLEAGQELMNVADAVQQLGKKKGSVTITIEFSKSGRRVITTAEVTSKVPKPEAEASMWYVAGNGLSRKDPMQLDGFDDEGEPIDHSPKGADR